jgi:apolipoprotein N-acyltransferase
MRRAPAAGRPPGAAATAGLLGAGALATVLAYPPVGWSPLAFGMLAPVVAAIEGARPRRAFALVWLYCMAMALVLVRWLVYALVEEYGVATVPAWTVTVLVVGAGALVPSSAAAAWAALRPRLALGAAPLAFAALWTLGEWLRAGPGGIPWLLAAQPLARVPVAIQAADAGGALAVGFWIVSVNAGLGLAWRSRRARPLLLPGVLAALAAVYGVARLGALHPSGDPMRVGVVQASVPQAERFRPGSALRNTRHHVELTRELAARGPLDLVVWSETAVDTDLDTTPVLRETLRLLSTEIGAALVTGAPRSADGHTNSVVLFLPGRGLVDSYAKQRLVPFSEYDPEFGAPLAALLGPVTEGEPYRAGREAHVFRDDGLIPFAAPVCFEITYPDLIRRFRARGARLLLNLSNDAWFGPSGYAEMHFDHAIFRAVELRTWIVRSANTGISGVIDPGSLEAEVWPAPPAPLYARAGDGPVLAALVGVLAASLALGRIGSSGQGRAGSRDA